LPYSYDVEVFPITTDWDEGRGVDVDTFSDKSYANWDLAKSNVYWTIPGGDYTGSYRSVQHFDQGDEDLYVDVTSMVNAWLTGGLSNYGLVVKMSSTLESGSSDFYVKKFYSRDTSYAGREPYLEASWDDSIKDDRNNFVFDYTGSLFLYNRVRGQLTDISGIGTGDLYVTVSDSSGTITWVTASHSGRTGIYSASFALPTGSYSGSTFYDAWGSGSYSYFTGTFYPVDNFSGNSVVDLGGDQYFVSITNLQDRYESDEVVRLNAFVRARDYQPAVLLTASSSPVGEVITKAYYRVDNDRTNEVIIPFGTGSTETTRLSYDKNGNYFKLYMQSLPAGNVYRIIFLFDVNGQSQIIDRDWKFKVV
jgi:hypothetical protein